MTVHKMFSCINQGIFIHKTIKKLEKRICSGVLYMYVCACVYTSLRGPEKREGKGSEIRKQGGKLQGMDLFEGDF